jgi:hypothetical protein
MLIWLLAGPLPLLMVLAAGPQKGPASPRQVSQASMINAGSPPLVVSVNPRKSKHPQTGAAFTNHPSSAASKTIPGKNPAESR